MQYLRILIGVLVFPAVLFLPAGRLDWPEAWAFLAVFIAAGVSLRVRLARRDPGLLRERLERAPDTERWDKVLMTVYPFLLLSLFVVSGLDAGRFGWSSVPAGARALGWLGLAAALSIVWWVMCVNPFASRWVRIQQDRGHEVIAAGPYRYVRHPMNLGVIVSMICIPVVLGSCWGLLPGAVLALVFVLRTALEDRTLLARLPGYRDYATRVRYRLLPWIW